MSKEWREAMLWLAKEVTRVSQCSDLGRYAPANRVLTESGLVKLLEAGQQMEGQLNLAEPNNITAAGWRAAKAKFLSQVAQSVSSK